MKRVIEKVAFPAHTAPKLTRVAAYARVSSAKDAMLHSLSTQVSYYNSLIQRHPGWIFRGVYADEGLTGTKTERKQFQRLMEDCRDGKINMVVTKSISRLARNTATLLETVRELKDLGVDVYFEEQNIHSISTDGELMLSILASYAQEESLSVSENQKWRIRHNFENGMPWNGTMLGYRYDNGILVIHPEEANVVRLIFDSYLEGMGATAIAKMLNESTAVSRFGNGWGQRSIMQILQNYTYTGNLMPQKTFSENHLTKKKRYNQGELPMYHIQDSHEAIISLDQFNAVHEENRRREEQHSRPHQNKGKYPFSGLLVCENCSKHYVRKTTATGAVWICPTYSSKGKAACPSKRIPENTLAAATLEAVGPPDAFDRKITAVRVEKDNTLVFCFPDGTTTVKRWQDRSRAESWTPEMRAAAAEKTRERKRRYA